MSTEDVEMRLRWIQKYLEQAEEERRQFEAEG